MEEVQTEQIKPSEIIQNTPIESIANILINQPTIQEETPNMLDEYQPTPIKRQKKKSKMVKNKSIDYNGEITIRNYINKPISSSNKKPSLNQSEDRILSDSKKINYEEVTQTEREMKTYLKRVEAFTNRINALKKQESELANRMVIMQKKEKEIEQIHNTKKKLKEALIKTKTDIDKEKEIRKEQVMMKKLTLQDKLDQYKRDNEQKKRQNIEIAKASQTLVKSMISQTNTKAETMNKYKCLQVKEGFAQYKVDEQVKSIEKEEQKKEVYMKKVIGEKEMIEKLKEKCEELEKIEEQCFEKLKTTKMKTNYFQSTYLLANKIKNETIEHLNNNNIQINQTATTNNTNSNNNSNTKTKDQRTKQKVNKVNNKKQIKVMEKKKDIQPKQAQYQTHQPQTAFQLQTKPKSKPQPKPQSQVKGNNSITVIMKKKAIKKRMLSNRPQSSRSVTKTKENELSCNFLNNSNYFSNYKKPDKPILNHKRNSSELASLSRSQMKYSTIV